MEFVLLAGALLSGALLTVQASANLQLTRAVGTPYGASTLQLWIAAALLAVLTALTGGLGALAGVTGAPAWFLLGGLASPLYITSGILLFPRLGALAAGGLFVAGQMLASVVLDLTGWLGVPQRPFGPGIAAGALVVITGIVVIVRTGSPIPAPVGAPVPGREPSTGPGWAVLGLVAGAALPVQGAVNARLRSALGQPFAVGLMSFLVAALTISVVLVVLLALRRTSAPHRPPRRCRGGGGWAARARSPT
jgi:bacterial/archaeal transporter family-2 protein